MTAMKTRAINEPVVQEISRDSVVSEAVVVKALNLHTCSVSDSVINNVFKIEITKDCLLTAIGGFFSVGFEDGSQHKEKLSSKISSDLCLYFNNVHISLLQYYVSISISFSHGSSYSLETMRFLHAKEA